jgi:hypothetical protein
MARLENAIIYQGKKTGNWICEIYDRSGFKAVGLGRTKLEAQARAYKIAGWDIKMMLPLMNAITNEQKAIAL